MAEAVKTGLVLVCAAPENDAGIADRCVISCGEHPNPADYSACSVMAFSMASSRSISTGDFIWEQLGLL